MAGALVEEDFTVALAAFTVAPANFMVASFMGKPGIMVEALIIMVVLPTMAGHITTAVAPIIMGDTTATITVVTGHITTAVTTARVSQPELLLRQPQPRSLATTLTTPASAITLLSLRPSAIKSLITNK